ncbi:sugar phosphate isomerase/epimerase [Occultella glacieicola]|uniref:Sugar phosphate isomerase/epimerase n=1 Tax=Occultella glacieicola TaxID=2518684 RepID=A0ABY2E9F0_9MICO|nr:TIM barrel protein [Occultella glacieicola]TDE97617.1 sugar phosphate isomerase/epimerase [Occultella glacieicola]
MSRARWRVGASTLGAPGEDLGGVIGTLGRHAVDVVELRAAPDALVHTELTAPERARVRQDLESAGIEVLAVASGVRAGADTDDDSVVSALVAHLHLAHDLGARFVRVFPGAPTHPAGKDELPRLVEDAAGADARIARRLAAVLPVAAAVGVRPVLETHDSHPRGADLVRVLDLLAAEHPDHAVGVIWDALHPWRVGERPAETAAALLPHLRDGRGYVQIKDTVSAADTTPVLQGTGAVPVDEVLDELAGGGYDGPVSLEWERTWYPQVETLGEALGAAVTAVANWPART